MRRALVLAVVLASAALAGCTLGADEEGVPTPRVVSRPATPAVRTPAELHLMSLHVTPNETELGAPVSASARVANVGDLAGSVRVRFEIVGGHVAFAEGVVEPRGSLELDAILVPTSGGNLAVRASAEDEELTVALLVRAPRVANVTVAHEGVHCQSFAVRFGFDNVGDAPAQDVRFSLVLSDEQGRFVLDRQASVGPIAPGARGEWMVEADHLRGACDAPPATFAYRGQVSARGLDTLTVTGVLTAG